MRIQGHPHDAVPMILAARGKVRHASAILYEIAWAECIQLDASLECQNAVMEMSDAILESDGALCRKEAMHPY